MIAACVVLFIIVKFGPGVISPKMSLEASKEECLSLARHYLDEDEAQSAIYPLLLAIQKDDCDFEAHHLLAKAYYASNIYHLAEKECQRSLELASDNADVVGLLCRIKYEQGRSRWKKQDLAGAILNFESVLDKTEDRDLLDSIAHITGGRLRMTRLTNDLFCDDAPSFSPDGKRIVYHSDTSYFLEDYGLEKIEAKKSRLFLIDADGKNKRCLSPGGEDQSSERFARFSHDGRFLVFERENAPSNSNDTIFNSDRDIFMQDMETGEARRLTNDDVYDGLPILSSDDKKMIFVSDRPGGRSRIHIMDLENGEIGSISLKESWEEKIGLLRHARGPILPFCPSFSPDGKRVLLHAGWRTRSIFLLDVKGENLQRLTDGESDCFFPSFSPDGKRIVFVSGRPERQDLYVIGAAGSDQTRLTYDGGTKRYPSYSPDGRSIVFAGKRKEEPDNYFEIYLLELDQPVSREILEERLSELKVAASEKAGAD